MTRYMQMLRDAVPEMASINHTTAAQVLVVTHSPQVAALAERHFVVSKVFENEKPLTIVSEVKGKGCVEEIARMISGDKITDEAREASRVLISQASKV